MALHEDASQALDILERLQTKLRDSNDATHEDDLTNLIYMLESPLFCQILNLNDSITQLKKVQAKYVLNDDDYDFDAGSGELILHAPEQLTEYDQSSPSVRAEAPTNQDSGADTSTNSEGELAMSNYATSAVFVAGIRAAAQGRGLEVIVLQKVENMSLGFSVVGLKSEHRGELGIFVQKIQPGGLAHRDGRLQENDHILAIDGEVLETTISHPQAISLLQRASGRVELVVARGHQGAAPVAVTTTEPGAPGNNAALDRTPSAVSDASDMVLSTEWTQLEVIDLLNDGSGLGFGIIGGKSTGVVVKTILPGGIADRDGRLRSGDHILQIGEVNVRGMGSEQVATVLRQSGAHVRLIVARGVQEQATDVPAHAPIVPTHQLDEHLHHLNEMLLALHGSQGAYLIEDNPTEFLAHLRHQEALERQRAEMPEGAHMGELPESAHMVSEMPAEEERFEVELVKDVQGLGITIAGYVGDRMQDELSGIFVRSIAEGSAAALDGRIQLNDQIIAVDAQPLEGFTNQQAVDVLRNTGQIVRLKLARYRHGPKYQQLQHYISQTEDNQLGFGADSETLTEDQRAANLYSGELEPDVEASLKTMWQPQIGEGYDIVVAQLSKFKEGGGLGISLEGTVDVENGVEKRPHHYIRSVLEDGPVGLNGVLQGGDELLEVNAIRLHGLNHKDVVKVLKDLPQHVRIVCARRLHDDDENEGDDDGTQEVFQESSFTTPAAPMSPATERLVKAKSDQDLPTHSGDAALSRLKSRSLEPLADFAMWSGEPTVIELVKGDRGLGFSILDYQDPVSPSETVIVIRSLVPGGVAQMDGRLVPGDRLIFVNDVNLENATLDQAVQALKGAPRGLVNIGVYKPLPLPEIGESSTDDFFDIPLEPAIGDVAPSIPPFSEASAFTAMEAEPPSLPSLSPPHSAPPTPPRTPPPSYDTLLPDNEAVTMVTEDAAGPEITEV